MGVCWYCTYGWPEPVVNIYFEALEALGGDVRPLEFGLSHIVWSDENFNDDCILWCLNENTTNGDYTEEQTEIVRESLRKLLCVPGKYRSPPPGFEDDDMHPEKFPPPSDWKMVSKDKIRGLNG